MKKLTGRQYAQHIPPTPAKTEVNRKGHVRVIRPAQKAKIIIHTRVSTNKKRDAAIRDATTAVGYVRWQDTEGAKRRGWK